MKRKAVKIHCAEIEINSFQGGRIQRGSSFIVWLKQNVLTSGKYRITPCKWKKANKKIKIIH